MPEIKHILDEARRIAGQDLDDRLAGKQGLDAQSVLVRLAEAAGLDFGDAMNLAAAMQWHHWMEGWDSGYRSGTDRNARNTEA